MTETMKAAVFNGVGLPLEITRLAMPKPREGEVLVKVAACGVCHTDLHVMQGDVSFPSPAVLGHEITGTIVELGPGVKNLSVGARVASSFMIPCGSCKYCSIGRDDMCENFFNYNRLRGQLYDGDTRLYRPDGSPVWMYSMGGLAEYCVVPTTDVFLLPDSLPLEKSAILGCAVFTAYGAVKHAASIEPGKRVAVIATGGVGLNAIQWAKAFGAVQVIALDISDEKLQLARHLGATDVVNVQNDPVGVVRELTDGQGVDVAIEALGSKQTLELAMDIISDGGRVVAVGISSRGSTAEIDMQRLVRRGHQIVGSYGARVRSDMPEIINLAAHGMVDYQTSITSRYTLDEADKAFQDLSRGQIQGRGLVVMEQA